MTDEKKLEIINCDSHTEYIRLARQTAIFPSDHAYMYCAVGFTGEVAEFKNTFPHSKTGTPKELGDCFWYHGLLTDIFLDAGDSKFDAHLQRDNPYFYRGTGSPYNNIEFLEKMSLRILDITKKIYRDDGGDIFKTEGKKINDVVQGLEESFIALCQLSESIHHTPQEIMRKNLFKLHNRASRNAISGSGDDR